MIVTAKNAVFGYGGRAIVTVDELNIDRGRCLGMFGPNGSGKTTLVRGIAGLIAPLQGTVQRDTGLCIGYMQQHRSMELHWPMTALDAASMALSARRRFGWLDQDSLEAISAKMRILEVGDLSQRSFRSLSGGQQQRVLLAGALAANPQLLILDEPTEGLDVRSRGILIRALRDASAIGLATIMISHSIDDVAMLSDEVAWLHEAELPGQPNHVELVAVQELVQRVMALRQSA